MDILHANDYMMAQTHIRLFHRLFYKVSLLYAAHVPRAARHLIDRVMLLQTACCLFLLLYVHQAFLTRPGTCLDPLVDSWPRDGIVRVQINTTKTFYSLPLELDVLYEDEELYIMEYSLHYAYLRMEEGLRANLSIPLHNHTLQKTDPCFGNFFSRFLLERMFGYDDVLMSSFKAVASNVSNKGFLRNVVTGEHYRFIDMWINKLNYLFSFILMLILTSVIAMLMRLCHHQLFKFFCKLLFALQQNQVLYPVWMPFPIASLLTMFLGLWGLETIMTELLDDPMVSFHLIAFVWMADNYYTICCHSYLARKYFPRFFYLSNYLFYAFHNQFNGQFSGLALVTTFLTTQTTMVWFYHRYEVPVIELFVSRHRRDSNPVTVESMVTSLVQHQQAGGHQPLQPYVPNVGRRGWEVPNVGRRGWGVPNVGRRGWGVGHYRHVLRARWTVLWRYVSQHRQLQRYFQMMGLDLQHQSVQVPGVVGDVASHSDDATSHSDDVTSRSDDVTSDRTTDDSARSTTEDPYLDITPPTAGLTRRNTTLSEELSLTAQSVSDSSPSTSLG